MDLGLVAVALLVALALLLPATALVFTVPAHPERAMPGRSGASIAAAATGVGLAALVLAGLLGAEPGQGVAIALLLGGSVIGWWPVARNWAIRGLVAWALTLDAGALYLGWVLAWTLSEGLTAASLVASLALWLLELFVFVIGIGYAWEFVDVLARRTWPRYLDPRRHPSLPDAPRPFVSLHVPTHNEPPELVIETLQRLLELDYDDYEILLLDNNTTDPDLWRPVEAFCATHPRISFIHLEDWPGFKSGALNYGLTQTDPRAEVIGIVDADYHVQPDFLADCAPLFADPDLSFVQTPQDYRSWEQTPYFRRLYYSYGYFFDVSQKSRNERNAAIFGGTMGLIRRSALEAVGGWDEWCITEDAELSLRLLQRGGHGLHIDRSYGHGVMPLTFEALKRQRYRWCFGGVQILRMHWRSLLPGRRTRDNQLSLAQRWGYLVGGLQWFGDLAALLFTGFLLAAALDATLGSGVVVRRLAGFLLLAVVVLLVLGVVRSLALVRRTSGATWREAFGAFGLWVALAPTVARACARGLFARKGVFLRTPKVRGELGIRHALLGNVGESVLAVACAVAAVAALAQDRTGMQLVGALLLVHAIGYATAPMNSVAAIRSDLPEDLQRRRRLMLFSWGPPARRGGLAFGLLAISAVVVVFSASPVGVPHLDELEEIVVDAPSEEDRESVKPDPSESPGTDRGTPFGDPTAPTTPPTATESPTGAAPPAPPQATDPTGAAPTTPPQATDPTGAAPTTPPQATDPTGAAPTTPPQATDQPSGKPTQKPTSNPTGPPGVAPSSRSTGRP